MPRITILPLWIGLGLSLTVSGLLHAETDVEQATRLMKSRNYPEAQRVLERTVQSDPRNGDALALLAELQLVAKNGKKAQEFADRAIQLNPTKSRYHLLRGNALGMQAQQGGMLKGMALVGDIRSAFEKAVELDPKSRDARIAVFNFYMNVPAIAGGGKDKAKAWADQTLAHDAALGHLLRGSLLQQKDPGNAQAEFRKAIAADPQYAPVYNSLGYVELKMNQVDLALEHFQKQVALTPESPNAYDSLGDGWQAKGRLDEALKAYRKAIELNPTFWASARNVGKVLEQAGRKEEAIAHYRRYIQLANQQGVPQAAKESRERLKALGASE